MVTCPRCGTVLSMPTKEWYVAKKTGKGPRLHVQVFEHCGKKFRIAAKQN